MRIPFFRSKSDKGKKQEIEDKVKLTVEKFPGIDDSLVIPLQPKIQNDWTTKEVKFIITMEKPC